MARSNLVHSASVQSESSFIKRRLSKATSIGGDYHLRTPQLDDARSGTSTLVRQNACERTSPIHGVSLSSGNLSNSCDVGNGGHSGVNTIPFRRAASTDLHHMPLMGFFSLPGNEPFSLTSDCVRLDFIFLLFISSIPLPPPLSVTLLVSLVLISLYPCDLFQMGAFDVLGNVYCQPSHLNRYRNPTSDYTVKS